MNAPPQLDRSFQQIIWEKSQNFLNCEFVFNAIDNFLHKHNRGYFTIIGAPGSGKSAILAKFATCNPNPNIIIIYYNAQVEGKNTAEVFMSYICTQLVTTGNIIVEAPFTSLHLSLLLQQISEQLGKSQKLIIAIDALDAVNEDNQPLATNLFYLPRCLPNGIYFLLTRRPFKKEKSGLLSEAPSFVLDLSEYDLKNWDSESAFTQHWQIIQGEGLCDITEKVLYILAVTSEGMSVEEIAETIN
jgi:ABC-type dipeptide/oligopeptide/nickel transport system ATPase component